MVAPYPVAVTMTENLGDLHRHSKLRLNPSIAASFSFKIWRLGDIHSARSECSQVKLDIR